MNVPIPQLLSYQCKITAFGLGSIYSNAVFAPLIYILPSLPEGV